MTRKKQEKIDELNHLSHELEQVRQQSLIASRKRDFRTVARLTCEAARLNREILAAEGSDVLVLNGLGDKLFTSDGAEPEWLAPATEERMGEEAELALAS